MEEKNRNILNKGIDTAISILRNTYPFILDWDYKYDPIKYKTSIYLELICDMDLASDYYNSPIKNVYKDSEAKVAYPFSILEYSSELDQDEKYETYKEIENSLAEIYDYIPIEYKYKSSEYDWSAVKDLYIDGFTFEKPKENITESEQKTNYLNMIKFFVESYKDRDYVCDVEVTYDEEDDYYIVTLWFDPDNLPVGERYAYLTRLELTKEIKKYIPIPNIFVGSGGKKGCSKKNITESKKEDGKVNLAKNLINGLFDEVSFIEQSTYNDRPLLTVYFDSDDTAANIESYFTHEICDTIKQYTSGQIKCNPSWGPEWRTNRNNPDILIDVILLEYDDEGNVLNESKDETNHASIIKSLVEPLNENWYKIPSSLFGPLEKVINSVMKKKWGWWKDIKINTLNYIDLYGDVQIEAELTVDEEWGANQWREFNPISQFPGNEGWEDNDGYSRRVSLGDITDSTYAEVIRDDLRDIFKYALNIEAYNMSFRNVYLIFE